MNGRKFAVIPAGLSVLISALAGDSPSAFREPHNTEPESRGTPMSPAEAVKTFRMPNGFAVDLFAAEPLIRQPIAMATDHRNRLWVAENYTYADSKVNYDMTLRDRVVILEDADRDGTAEGRKVFWDGGKVLTSVELGRGGVFVVCPPQMLFLPDRNADDIPDGEPEVLLDGFSTTTGNRHTFANGLRWGPDGWLWGRIGISSGARIGTPGQPDATRVEMRGGIWRYHPERRVVEAVAHGTTNPWGMDWNEVGEPFFINTVIGHLWHAIPGAHFRRMHGEDVGPRSYGLIEQHADHFHFDTGAGWTKSRAADDGAVAPASDALGGGHAHTGLLIYQGPNWPESTRGKLFTINFHGRRLNTERLERSQSGYMGRHGDDFLSIGDPWFRGVDLISSADGSVLIADWSDTGECHDHDGIHRTSGRIYRVRYGVPTEPDLSGLKGSEVSKWVELAFSDNAWMARKARVRLADFSAGGGKLPESVRSELIAKWSTGGDRVRRLRALWAMIAAGCAVRESLLPASTDPDEHIRSWAVRMLVDHLTEVDAATLDRLAAMAAREESPFVRLYLASALQRIPVSRREPIARALLQRAEDALDHNLPLMIWYGVEPIVGWNPNVAATLAVESRIPIVREFLSRAIGEGLERHPAQVSSLLQRVTAGGRASEDVLLGLAKAWKGWRKAAKPQGWDAFAAGIAGSREPGVLKTLQDLQLLFGDGRALADLQMTAQNASIESSSRIAAIQTMIANPDAATVGILRKLADDGAVRTPALVGLLKLAAPDAHALVTSRYKWVGREERPLLVAALAERPAGAQALLDAMKAGAVPPADLAPHVARQIRGFGIPRLNEALRDTWGTIGSTDAGHVATLGRFRTELASPEASKSSLSNGRQVFQKACATCHRLYGEGAEIGPDLTGSARANPDYLLENLVTPSAVVPAAYRLAVVTLKDERVLNGLVVTQNERTITLRTVTENLVMEKSTVKSLEFSEQSMMPEGLLEALSGTDRRDLLAYLMHPRQVPLP